MQIFNSCKNSNLEHKENGHYFFSRGQLSWNVFSWLRVIEKINGKRETRRPSHTLILVILRRSFFKYWKLGPAHTARYDTNWSLFMHSLVRGTAIQRQKTTTYIMRQIAECCSSVTSKSGPVIKKFGTTKEPFIERRDRSSHPSSAFNRIP